MTRIVYYVTTDQGLASIRLDGYDRRVHMRVTGKGTPPQQPSAGTMKISPDRSRVFLELQGKHYIVTVPRTGRDTVNVSLAAPTSNVPVKKMSVFGGDYLNLVRRRQERDVVVGNKALSPNASTRKSRSNST